MKENAPRHLPSNHAPGSKDLNGWVVAGLFMLFLCSLAVYRVASLNSPVQEETTAENHRMPLPAGPRKYDSGQ
jgi:hypothetical protein